MFTVRKKRKMNAGAQLLHQLHSSAVIKASVAMATHRKKNPVLSRQRDVVQIEHSFNGLPLLQNKEGGLKQ